MHQQRYLQELQEEVSRGLVLTQKETAKRAHVSEYSVCKWNWDEDFRSAASRIIRSQNDFRIELVHRAVIDRAIGGSIKHAELAFRVAGRLRDLEGENDAPGAVAHASVTFVGLPQPPNGEQRARLNPPPGSSLVLNVDGTLEQG